MMKSIKPKIIYHPAIQLVFFIVFFQYMLLDFSVALGETATNLDHLTDVERSWLDAHPIIRLAPDPEFQPIEYFDKNGNYAGIGADYVKLIAKKLGIKFEVVKCTNWEDVLARMKRREVDVLNAVVQTPERVKYLNFPPPYLKIPSVIIVRKKVTGGLTLDRLKGMTVVMISGYGYVDLIRNKHPKMKIELVSDLKAALRKVSFGMADAFVGDLATASFYIESEGITNLKLGGESEPPNISGFAVRSDWPELSRILEKGVALLTEEERKTILNKWIRLAAEPLVTMRELKILTFSIVSFISFVIGGFLLWNRQLKRKVDLKTEALTNEINERKQTQEALIESEEKFRAIAETSPLAIYMSEGIEQKAVYINPTFIRLFGYTMYEVPNVEHWWPLAYPDKKYRRQVTDEWQNKVEKAIQFNSEIEPIEVLVTCKDGSTKTISWGFINIGEQSWAFGLNLTEQKKAEEEKKQLENRLQQAQKMEAIGTLAGGIAHDFNNLLAVILGYTDLAKEDAPPGTRFKHDLEEVAGAAHRAKDLVKQILAFSRQTEVERLQIKIQPLITESLRMLRSSIPTTISIIENIDPRCGNILADPSQVHQILMNLCTNAYHAMEVNGGTLSVALKTAYVKPDEGKLLLLLNPGEYVKFTISDTGVGIGPDVIKKIFDPYFTTKEIGRGTGMGLAIIHGILQEWGGAITVDSQLGKGATFHVYFPVVKENVLPATKKQEDIPRGKERVLFIDDEEILADMGKDMLERLGYHVTVRYNSLEALETFQNQPDKFDIVITDLTMPGMTGSDMSRRMLQIRPDIPIILCTGYSTIISEGMSKSMGIKEFAFKPLAKKDIAKLIRKVLNVS